MKIRRFSGHPQVRDWAIIPFQGEYQVSVVTGNWTTLMYNYIREENSQSVAGNRMCTSIRTRSLLPLYSSAVCFSSLMCFILSISLKLWYLMIARVPDLCSPCQIFSHPPSFFHQTTHFIWHPSSFVHILAWRYNPNPPYLLFLIDTLHIDALHSILTMGDHAVYPFMALFYHGI